jgi:hypothetical protein
MSCNGRRTMSKKSRMPAGDWFDLYRRLEAEGGLLISVGIQGDGAVYVLEPSAEERLEGVKPHTPRPRSVFIGHHRVSDFDTVQPPHWPRVVEMLTGLTAEQLKEFTPIRILSPGREGVIWEWQPEPVSSPR